MFVKAGLLAAVVVFICATADAKYFPDFIEDQIPLIVGQSQVNKTVTIDFDVGVVAYALFGAGTFVGLMATYGQDLKNPCLSDANRLTVASVHTYEYMTEYIDGGKQDNIVLAQGIIYIIDFFETLSVIDCTTFPEDAAVWIETQNWAELFAIETSVPPQNVQSSPTVFPFV